MVGVSADTYLMGSRNPETQQDRGLRHRVRQAIGEALFADTGDGFNVGRDIQFRVITAGNRIPLLGGPDAEGETRPPSSTS